MKTLLDSLPDYTCDLCGEKTKLAMRQSRKDNRVLCLACSLSESDKSVRRLLKFGKEQK